jgi:hypothetical protein
MEYTLQDGTKVRGRELLDRIMGSINALSDLGKEKIKSQLLNEDGTIDIDKFSEFLSEHFIFLCWRCFAKSVLIQRYK